MTSTFKIENKRIKYSMDDLLLDQISIQSVPFNYIVRFVDRKQLSIELRKIKSINKKRNFVFIDKTVASFYGKNIFKNEDLHELIAKESNKTLPSVTKLVDTLSEKNYTKKEIFISAGGGITQDVSSFARAIFKRGIHWTYLPTTLLAMADSCIGAKACLNYDGIKNLLGLFSAPREVFIFSGFLNTLNKRDILSGYGEILKLAIVGGSDTMNKFRSISRDQNRNQLKNIDQMIKLALLVKKSIIEIDEYEHNIRRALNFGHTVGHAIEPLTSYKIPHGIAVSIGMVMENHIASLAGRLSQSEAMEMNELIFPFIDNLSLNYLKKVSPKDLISNMKRDKKALDNDIYMSVPAEIGHFEMLKVPSNVSLEKSIKEMTQNLLYFRP
jgi:3-dehydroquinate synthase